MIFGGKTVPSWSSTIVDRVGQRFPDLLNDTADSRGACFPKYIKMPTSQRPLEAHEESCRQGLSFSARSCLLPTIR